MNSTLLKAGLILGLGLAVVAPAATFAAAPGSSTTTPQGTTKGSARIDAIAAALGLTPQQVRTTIKNGTLLALASETHLTTAQVAAKLKASGVKVPAAMKVGRRSGIVAWKAVAAQLQMTPQALRQAIRQHSLTLPTGVTIQSLQGVAQSALQNFLQGIAAKQPKLTAQRQQSITQRVLAAVGKKLTQATTPAATGAAN